MTNTLENNFLIDCLILGAKGAAQTVNHSKLKRTDLFILYYVRYNWMQNILIRQNHKKTRVINALIYRSIAVFG